MASPVCSRTRSADWLYYVDANDPNLSVVTLVNTVADNDVICTNNAYSCAVAAGSKHSENSWQAHYQGISQDY